MKKCRNDSALYLLPLSLVSLREPAKVLDWIVGRGTEFTRALQVIGVKRPNSRTSGAFSEQLSALHLTTQAMSKPIFGAILGATPGIVSVATPAKPHSENKKTHYFVQILGGGRTFREVLVRDF